MPDNGKCPRAFCFTYNNPEDHIVDHLKKNTNLFSYIVWGYEVGDKGTPHLQGYAECKDQYRFAKVTAHFHSKAAIAARKGSAKQAAGYCKKGQCETHIKLDQRCEFCRDFTSDWSHFFDRSVDVPETWQQPFELGEISNQGKRTDLTEPTRMIVEDCLPIATVAKLFPEQYVKFNKGFRDLRSLMIEPRQLSAAPEVVVLYGPTGTGKTRDAYIKYWPDEPHYVWRPSNGNWWDGYDGQKKIIVDEFRAQMTWSDILGLLCRNEFRAPFKGGFVNIVADKFVFTSPFPPREWYKKDDRYDRYAQLQRRITKVIEYPMMLEVAA